VASSLKHVDTAPTSNTIVESDIQARLDRLPGRFHTLVVVAHQMRFRNHYPWLH
jgi:hypothetical protein